MRATIALASLILLSACVQPMQQAAVPLPVVPADQRITEFTVAALRHACDEKPGVSPAKASAWCQCLEEHFRISVSRNDAVAIYNANEVRPGDTAAVNSAAPVLRAIRNACVQRVQPY